MKALHLIPILALLLLAPAASAARLYLGPYPSGTAAYAYDTSSGRLYRGHHASGTALCSIAAGDEIPNGLLLFLVACLLS